MEKPTDRFNSHTGNNRTRAEWIARTFAEASDKTVLGNYRGLLAATKLNQAHIETKLPEVLDD